MTEFFLNIVNMSISAGWIVLAMLILRLLLKKAPKWITVLLWGIVAFRLICPFSIESTLSLIPSTQTINPEYALNSVEIDSGIPIIDNTINPIISGAMVTVQPEKDINFFHIIMPYLAGIWLVGIFALLLYTVISYVRLKKKIETAVLYKDNIFQSENVISPFVLGIIKPKIYLPFNMTDNDMENVVAHEQAHIKRKDHLWKPLGFLLLTIHWFNPLMWVGYIMLCKDIELACDEKVVKNLDTEQRADYSQALLSCSVNRRMIAACPIAFGEVGVKSRIKTVLNYKKPAFWIFLIAIIASIVAAVCFMTDPASNTLRNIEFLNLSSRVDNTVSIALWDGETFTPTSAVSKDLLNELCDIKISRNEISRNRSEDRDKTHTLVLQTQKDTEPSIYSYVEGCYICFDSTFTSVWVDNKVKPTLSYRVINPLKAKQVYEDIANYENQEKITWTYNPTLSYTGHYTRGFVFDFDYTHVEATCTEGEMWNFDVEGQPRDTAMRFEKGKNVYWTPSEAVIEKLPKKSEVTLTIFNNKTQLYKCTVIFECVSRDLGSAEFEIYFKKSDGLGMVQSGEGILLFESSSISNVGGADNPNNIITEIIDRTVTEKIPTDQAMQPFCADEKYIYSFPSIRSEYVIVKFNNGDEMTVSTALGKGLITIADLDKWKIQYSKKEYDGDLELNENGDIVRISSYPKSNELFDITAEPYSSDTLKIVTEKGTYSIEEKVIKYSITNIDDEEHGIAADDDCFSLQKMVDGQWKRVGTKNEHSWNSLGQILNPKQTEQREIDLDEYFNLPLDEGTYRIVVEGLASNTFEIS